MASSGRGVSDAADRRAESPVLTLARALAAAALVMLAAGAAFVFLVGAVVASDPEYFGERKVNMDALLLGLAGVVAASCVSIWGLAKGSARAAFAGVGGIALAATTVLVALEVANPPAEELALYRAVFVLVLGMDVTVALIAWRLRKATPDDAHAR